MNVAIDFSRIRAEVCRSFTAHGLARAIGLDKRARRQARGLIVPCPFHDDRSPSFSLRDTDDGPIGSCFACNASADAIKLVAHALGLELEGAGYIDALKATCERAGRWDLVVELEGERRADRAPPPSPAVSRERTHEIAQALVEMLERMPRDVEAYLARRHVLAWAQALGCVGLPAPAEQGPIVAAMLERFPRADLEAACVVRRGRDAIWWNEHRLLIPWRRRDGSIATIQRRLLRPAHDGERKYMVPSGAMRELEPFGAHAFAIAAPTMPDAEVVVVEGALDACARRELALHAGDDALVLGSFNVTSERTHAWAPFVAGRRVRVALDADDAGDAASPALGATLLEQGAREIVRERPRGGDWGDVLTARRAA